MSQREADREKRRSIRRQRDTSISALEELRRSGRLTRLRWLIYEYLWNVGPATAQETFKALNLETNQSGRFTELRDRGLIREVGKLICEVTGRRVIGWDVTDPDCPPRTQKVKPEATREERLERVLVETLEDLRAHADLFTMPTIRKLERELAALNKE